MSDWSKASTAGQGVAKRRLVARPSWRTLVTLSGEVAVTEQSLLAVSGQIPMAADRNIRNGPRPTTGGT